MENVEEFDYRGHKVVIGYDPDPEDPREWSNVATLVCEHRRYILGDEHDVEAAANELFDKYVSESDALAYIKRNNNSFSQDEYDNSPAEPGDYLSIAEKLDLVMETGNVEIAQISGYEHGGLTIWCGPIGNHPDAQWDCGILGFAYVEKTTARKEGMLNPGPKYDNDWRKWAYTMMKGEVEAYDAYIRGEVYYYDIDDEDSCGGYYSIGECESEAKSIIDYMEDEL